jgi:polysaccharide deacetylase family protein (PEP-CTERM system associated)
MGNLLTVEVEEYFHDEGFAETGDRSDWERRESRVRAQTERLLDLFGRKRVRATFFVLGWTAEHDPALVREIAARGHEVASHGMSHLTADLLDEDAFRLDVRRGKALLEEILGAEVTGYRAPGFSIDQSTRWPHRVLAEEGFLYSSSVRPARFGERLDPEALPRPWTEECGGGLSIVEFPPLTRRLAGQNVPLAGGNYLRLLPVRIVSQAIAAMNEADAPAVVSLRPWEIDASLAEQPESPLSRWRRFSGVEEFADKLGEILDRHEFGPIGEFPGLRRRRSPAKLVAASHAD